MGRVLKSWWTLLGAGVAALVVIFYVNRPSEVEVQEPVEVANTEADSAEDLREGVLAPALQSPEPAESLSGAGPEQTEYSAAMPVDGARVETGEPVIEAESGAAEKPESPPVLNVQEESTPEADSAAGEDAPEEQAQNTQQIAPAVEAPTDGDAPRASESVVPAEGADLAIDTTVNEILDVSSATERVIESASAVSTAEPTAPETMPAPAQGEEGSDPALPEEAMANADDTPMDVDPEPLISASAEVEEMSAALVETAPMPPKPATPEEAILIEEAAPPEPEPEAEPAPLLPAPDVADAMASPRLPEVPIDSAGSVAAEATPLYGDSSPPLTLAQVLLPGAAPKPGQIAPSFDLVRVAPDGSAVIAGRAEPGANVQVFSGNVPIAEAKASARGEFVVFLDPPTEETLDTRIPVAPEGAELVVSQDDIVILPALENSPEASPIVLRRTPDAVQIVQPSGPAIPSNVSLDLVSYADSGAVLLAGRGRPGNTARIYANGDLAGEVLIASGGNWELEIADIAQGRYVLRVDEITEEGDVASRTESPFQRDFPEAQLPSSFSQGAKIIVQPGNTLWLMATEAYGDGGAFTQIFSANKDAIRDPDLIYPGQIFSIPRTEE